MVSAFSVELQLAHMLGVRQGMVVGWREQRSGAATEKKVRQSQVVIIKR